MWWTSVLRNPSASQAFRSRTTASIGEAEVAMYVCVCLGLCVHLCMCVCEAGKDQCRQVAKAVIKATVDQRHQSPSCPLESVGGRPSALLARSQACVVWHSVEVMGGMQGGVGLQ